MGFGTGSIGPGGGIAWACGGMPGISGIAGGVGAGVMVSQAATAAVRSTATAIRPAGYAMLRPHSIRNLGSKIIQYSRAPQPVPVAGTKISLRGRQQIQT